MTRSSAAGDLAPAPDHSPGGRIGPNAILRVLEVLAEQDGMATAIEIFRAAGLSGYVLNPPTAMVDEEDVAVLHRSLRVVLGNRRARAVGYEAGRRTGTYLLENRIPRLAQKVIGVMPRRLGARVLTAAILRNQWTFAGSGALSAAFGASLILTLSASPLLLHPLARASARAFYAGAFECLFQRLISAKTDVRDHDGVRELDCCFHISWSARVSKAGLDTMSPIG